MSNLNAFLHPVQGDETREVIISKRFVGEDGKPVPFKIRALTQEENQQLTKEAKRKFKANGVWQERMDTDDYIRRLVVAATLEPDFKSEEMCKAYGTLDPLEVPGKMLYAGEYTQLEKEISILSGFDIDSGALEEEAKN